MGNLRPTGGIIIDMAQKESSFGGKYETMEGKNKGSIFWDVWTLSAIIWKHYTNKEWYGIVDTGGGI